jgi:hypothetical protein
LSNPSLNSVMSFDTLNLYLIYKYHLYNLNQYVKNIYDDENRNLNWMEPAPCCGKINNRFIKVGTCRNINTCKDNRYNCRLVGCRTLLFQGIPLIWGALGFESPIPSRYSTLLRQSLSLLFTTNAKKRL